MTGAILFDKKERTSLLYRELSLDCPISRNSEETFLDRLPAKNGDFTNGVAFFDFIGRLPSAPPSRQRRDARFYGLSPTPRRKRHHKHKHKHKHYHYHNVALFVCKRTTFFLLLG